MKKVCVFVSFSSSFSLPFSSEEEKQQLKKTRKKNNR